MRENETMRYANIIDHFSAKTRLKKIPFSGTFELTPRCNMNCKMCYIRMDQKEMEQVGTELPVEEWIRIAREAVDAGLVMALLTGGEAILYKGFKKFYLELRKMGVFVSINSNGTMLNGEWMEFFKQYPPAKFNLTIYGGSNETYARLCNNPKGFDQLKATVETLQKNHIEVYLNCMITKQNVEDLEELLAFAKEHDLQLHAATYAFPPVRKEGVDAPELNRFTPREAAKARVLLNRLNMTEEAFKKHAFAVAHTLDQDETQESECGEVVGEKVQCAAGRSNFWITWDGRFLGCGMIPDSELSIRDHSFMDIWKETVAYTETITLASECKNCSMKKLCVPCAAKLKAETGFYNKKSDYLCEYIREYVNLMREEIEGLTERA